MVRDAANLRSEPDSRLRFEPFPTEKLPAPLAEFVRHGAECIGCDPSFIATPLLPAVAAAIGNTRRIQVKQGWVEPTVLWSALVGDSGTQKSPALSFATAPLEVIDCAAHQAFEPEIAEHRRKRLNYEADLHEWRQKKRLGNPPEEPQTPVPLRFLISDITVEALADRLQEQPRGLLLVRDELAGWLRGFDAYKGGKGGDVAHWLSMYGAQSMRVDRKGDGGKFTFVPRASVCVTGGIQPDTLRRSLGQEHWENGLAARLLLAQPPRRRRQWTEAAVPEILQRGMTDLFAVLTALRSGDNAAPIILPFSESGHDRWVIFFNAHAEETAQLHGPEAALWSKLEGCAARLALILHLVRVANEDASIESARKIDGQSVETAVELANWFGNEGRRIYATLAETPESRQRRQLSEFIAAKGRPVSARDVAHDFTALKNRPEEAEVALQALVTAGYGQWEPSSGLGRPTRRFILDGQPATLAV